MLASTNAFTWYLDDIGDQLCDRVLTVLLEIWLQACAKNFPSPRLWKTLTDLAQTWRHRYLHHLTEN